jgi:hypothetical protein
VENTISAKLETGRAKLLSGEISYALSRTSPKELSAWGIRCGDYLIQSAWRRITNVSKLGKSLGRWFKEEKRIWTEADSIDSYFKDRKARTNQSAQRFRGESKATYYQLRKYFQEQPAEAATRLALLCLGFEAGSGGLDGDGGIPDLDWTLLDEHRSLLTHSIVAGVIVEISVLAFIDLVDTIHKNLPENHDPIWDSVNVGSKHLSFFAHGVSFGLAYHLGVDATIDGDGKYQGLPVSIPQKGHQILAGVNALMEGLDAVARARSYGDVVQTFPTLNSAKTSIMDTEHPSSYKVTRLDNDDGFVVLWCPART